MTRDEHLRRVVLLTCHFARNFAYYRAAWDGATLANSTDFWKTVSGNCFDLCVLEWCKLFGDPKGEHSWQNVVSDPDKFEAGFYPAVALSAADFEVYRLKTRGYRDKFVAHLDLEKVAYLPHLDPAWASVRYYHSYVVASEISAIALGTLPKDLEAYRASKFSEATPMYRK